MKFTTTARIRDIMQQLRSDRGEERHEGAVALRCYIHELPKVGAFDNSRARGKQAIAVPRELLEHLADRAGVCEFMLDDWMHEFQRAEDLQQQLDYLKGSGNDE